ncbi:MAG: DUF1634 domain-containing protein [Candidatus Methanosuratincola sp.]|jgi:uncharacterized membrane protein|nr:DUF1634 domain-containing protein [Candidatus Methanosuratincola sp.]
MVNVEDLISLVLRTGVLSGVVITSIGFFTSSEVAWLGVLVLILTPFMRVIMAGLYFLSRKDTVYAALAAYVIMILVIGSFLHII